MGTQHLHIGMTLSIDNFGLASMTNELKPELLQAIGRVIDSGNFVLGSEVEAFEEAFAQFVGTRHCVLVANGLDALQLALASAGIGPGDEVIVPSQTFVATLVAPLRLGATAVLVDVHPVTGLIDVEKVADAIGPRTAAVVPVHLHGALADIQGLRKLADRHGFVLVEDAAQAHGAAVGGAKAGSFGLAGAFSFYPTKNLGALGDAGCITTSDPKIAATIRSLRNYSRHDYADELIGLPGNSRTDAVQAAVLGALLPRLPDWNNRRRSLARTYMSALELGGLEDLAAGRTFDESHVYHHFALLVPDRDRVVQELRGEGVHLLTHYSSLPHEILASRCRETDRKGIVIHSEVNARLNAKHSVSLPLHPFLSTSEVEEVSRMLLDIVNETAIEDLKALVLQRQTSGRSR